MIRSGMLSLVLSLAWRSLWSHRVKSFVVGTIILFGVFLLVVADAMLDSINEAMESSITASITGHLQVFDERAEDQLSLMGTFGTFFSRPHVGQIDDYEPVQKVLERHPNVQALVPMGSDNAVIFKGNSVDQAVTALREKMQETKDPQALAPLVDKIKLLINHLVEEYAMIRAFSGESTKAKQAETNLAIALQDSFWQELYVNPEPQILFLETRIAPLINDANPVFLDLLGTDFDQFEKAFSRFKIVKGQRVPTGKRGLLVNDEQYERFIKDRIAQVFDAAYEKIYLEGLTIAEDRELVYLIERRVKEYKQWMLSFAPEITAGLQKDLGQFLNRPNAELGELIQDFLQINDGNFKARYDFFYANIAPVIDLYPVKVGDRVTLKKLGLALSQQVTFYGTYQFDGVEKSGFSSIFHLVDLITFREMYGFITEEKRAEINELKKEFAVAEFSSDSVEDALFSGESEIFGDFDKSEFISFGESEDEGAIIELGDQEAIHTRVYTSDEINKGAIINVAVVLKDPSLREETQEELEALIAENGLRIQVINWQAAAGYVGQMITVMKIVLITFMVFVFCVSMVVVNNAMLMATMHRYHEIGTLRAIGASRNMIMGIFLTESLILTLIASLVGALLGIALILYLGSVGIPAPKFEFQFLFGGKSLFPRIELVNLYLGPLVILLVSVVATFYPALLATRVSPVVAMNARE